MRAESTPLFPYPEELQGINKFIATLAIIFPTFLLSLSQFIANASIPTITGTLAVSQEDGSWITTSYTVASGFAIALTGFLTTVFGRVRLFSLAAVLFGIISLLCGLAVNYPMLVFFRTLQGFVGGFMIPLSLTLLLLLYPRRRSFAIVLWSFIVVISPTLGPLIGGWITYTYHWSWIFKINVPFAVLAGCVVYALPDDFESLRKKVPVDAIGIVLLALIVFSYQVALDKGNDADWWDSNFIVALTILVVVGVSFFIVWELYHPNPILHLRFFKRFNFTIGTLITGMTLTLLFGSLILEPNWVQGQLGYTQTWAGRTIVPFWIAAAFFFPLVGMHLDRLDLRFWISLGFILLIPSFFYLAYLSIETPFSNLAWPRFFQGIGFSLFYLPLTVLCFKGISAEETARASSLFNFVRSMFISTGVSGTTIYFHRRENFFQSRYVESVIPSNPQYEVYFQTLKEQLGLTGPPVDAFTYNMVINQAFTETFLEICYLQACGFIVLILLTLLFKIPNRASTS